MNTCLLFSLYKEPGSQEEGSETKNVCVRCVGSVIHTMFHWRRVIVKNWFLFGIVAAIVGANINPSLGCNGGKCYL